MTSEKKLAADQIAAAFVETKSISSSIGNMKTYVAGVQEKLNNVLKSQSTSTVQYAELAKQLDRLERNIHEITANTQKTEDDLAASMSQLEHLSSNVCSFDSDHLKVAGSAS